MISGYYSAISAHEIQEPGPQMTQGHFGTWLSHITGWETNCGWAHAITKSTEPDTESQFLAFFDFLDQYKLLVPIVIASTALHPTNQPPREHANIWNEGQMKTPDEIHVVNYAPTKLFHLRYRYGKRIVDDWIMGCIRNRDISYESSLDYAIHQACKKFNIESNKWVRYPAANHT